MNGMSGIAHPVNFVRKIFKVEPLPYQIVAMEKLYKTHKLAWRAGHGVGKTAFDAWIVIWFLLTHPYSKIITTGPTGRQVKHTLWSEISTWYHKMPYALQQELELLSQTLRVKKAPKEWYAFGFSAKKGVNVEGWHKFYILLVIDEAKGVDKAIFDSLQGAMTSQNAYQLWTSTPGMVADEFYKPFSNAAFDSWATHHTSCFEAPEWLISKQWFEDRRKEWGEGSALWEARVLGEFPTNHPDQLINQVMIKRAIERWKKNIPLESDAWRMGNISLGLDIARSEIGGAENVAIIGNNQRVFKMEAWRSRNTMYTVGKTVELCKEYRVGVIKADVVAVGSGVVDRLIEKGYKVIEINGGDRGDKIKRPDVYDILRDEMYYDLADKFREDRIDIPDDEILSAQLLSIKKVYTSEKLKIESKKSMFSRGLSSPDRADSLAMQQYNSVSHNQVIVAPQFGVIENFDTLAR